MASTKEQMYIIPEQGTWVNSTVTTILDDAETKNYEQYELNPDSLTFRKASEITSTDILDLCDCVNEEIYDGHIARTYVSDKIFPLINNCKKIDGISSLDNIVYITYTTTDGYEVTLGYSLEGIVEKCVYNPEEDIAVSISDEASIKYSNFRYGSYYEMSDATLNYIEECVESNDIMKLENTVGLSVTTEDDFTIIEEVPIAKVVAPPTTENGVANTLKSDFPQYSQKQVYTTTGTSTALGKSVSIRVYETRANYVKKSVNIANYGAGTLLSVIMTALGFNTVTPVAAILSSLGVAYTAASEAGKLQSAANLCRTAKYSFTGNRRGDVYDSTRYNNYVKVIDLTSSGEFSYGYDKNGNYLWIVSMEPTCYNTNYSTIANDALKNYNWDVALNGFCSQYAPA